MQALDEIIHLATQVQQLERQAAELTNSWYEFTPAEQDEPAEVANITQSSTDILEQLSQKLNLQLQQAEESSDIRPRLQYAYNTAQELLQSREAAEAMTSDMVRDPGTAYQEYLRAVALKEQTAVSQVDKLVDTLVQVQSQKSRIQ